MLDTARILDRLDAYLNRNDGAAAERHLLYWLSEAVSVKEGRAELLLRNELMGLYRKQGKRDLALEQAEVALELVRSLSLSGEVVDGTTHLNAATVCKAFGQNERALSLYSHARAIYERELSPTDSRLGGLYNNMGLALVEAGRFEEANEVYHRALEIMQNAENGDLGQAITYLNMANAAEAALGLEEAQEQIESCLQEAERLLEGHEDASGYYAFVCEKCASVYGYYGYFVYEGELRERARRIYEGA